MFFSVDAIIFLYPQEANVIYPRTCALIASLLLIPISGWAATPSPSTTMLAVSSSTVAKNTAVTLTAAVNSGGKTVSPGRVLFCDATATYCEDSAILGTAQLTSAGTASIKLRMGIGTHSIKAVFVGTNTVAGSSSDAQSLTVTGKHSSMTTVSTSGSAGNYTLSANVSGIGDLNVGPTGNVSFQDAMNNRVVASAALGASTPTLSFGPLLATFGPTASGPNSHVTGDFNNDGKLDLVIANATYINNQNVTVPGSISVSLGKGDGTFQNQVTYPADNPVSVAVGDFNSDGKPDLVVANLSYVTQAGVTVPGSIGVFLGNGDGTFQNQVTYPANAPDFTVAVGDFNRDGIPDLAVGVNANSGTIEGVGILLGNGDGTFQSEKLIYTTTSAAFLGAAVSDFNGDGKLDIAMLSQSGLDRDLTVLLGNGDGTFQSPLNSVVGGPFLPDSLLAGDFNGDGKADLAVFTSITSGPMGVLLSNGNGTFQNVVTYSAPNGGEGLYLGDFNGDGILDMLTKNSSGDPNNPNNLVGIFLGKGNGTFQNVISVPDGSIPVVSVYGTGDFNGDGYPDLILWSGDIGVALNESGQTATVTAANVNAGSTQYVYAHYSGDSNYWGSLSCQIGLNTPHKAPVISGVTVSNITSTSATISWTSNVATYGGVSYGLTSPLSSTTPWVVPVSTTHSFTLAGLTPGSTYNYRAWSVSYFSGCTTWTTFSPTASFTTAK